MRCPEPGPAARRVAARRCPHWREPRGFLRSGDGRRLRQRLRDPTRNRRALYRGAVAVSRESGDCCRSRRVNGGHALGESEADGVGGGVPPGAPPELDPVTRAIFWRGWPICPFMNCPYRHMAFSPTDAFVEQALIYDFAVFVGTLLATRFLVEWGYAVAQGDQPRVQPTSARATAARNCPDGGIPRWSPICPCQCSGSLYRS